MKKLTIATSLAALLLITGCSKQPTLENATETNQTNQTELQNQGNLNTANAGNESVNTENANVETQNIGSAKVSVETNNQQFAKSLSNIVIHFDFDKYNIEQSEWPKVEQLAKLIKDNPANYTVRIEGNCDEWGTEEYNYALGLKRANEVKKALIKLGVDSKKLTVISYGELNPVCTEHNKKCWKLNRRDNFTYLP